MLRQPFIVILGPEAHQAYNLTHCCQAETPTLIWPITKPDFPI
jgi:hypothetical protein